MDIKNVSQLYFPSNDKARFQCEALLQSVIDYRNGIVPNTTVFSNFNRIRKANLAICVAASVSLSDKDVAYSLTQLLEVWDRW